MSAKDKPTPPLAQTAPQASVTVTQLRTGQWTFVLKNKGVTYPAQGQFTTMEQARFAGQSALYLLQKS